MGKEVDKLVKEFKVMQKRLKTLTPSDGEKLKKAILGNIDKTWADEDVLQEAIQKARAGGVTSKKSADFIKHADVAAPFKKWQTVLKVHVDAVDAFSKFNEDARKMHTDLTKLVEDAEKAVKKSGESLDKAAQTALKDAKKALPEIKKAQGLLGTMKANVIMYGMNQQRTIDGVVKTAIAAVTPKEFPEPLSEKNRKNTAKVLKDNLRKIEKFCSKGYDALEAGDHKNAAKCLKAAEGLFEPIEGFQKEGKATKSKMQKEMKAAKDGKDITALIKAIKKVHDQADGMIESLSEDLEEKLKEA